MENMSFTSNSVVLCEQTKLQVWQLMNLMHSGVNLQSLDDTIYIKVL